MKTQKDIQREFHVKTEAKIEVMRLKQGSPKIASDYQKLERARQDSPLGLSGEAWPCGYLDFRTLASRTMRE